MIRHENEEFFLVTLPLPQSMIALLFKLKARSSLEETRGEVDEKD